MTEPPERVGSKPGEIHPVDQAFYDLTVKQRDSAWREVEQLKEALATALHRAEEAEALAKTERLRGNDQLRRKQTASRLCSLAEARAAKAEAAIREALSAENTPDEDGWVDLDRAAKMEAVLRAALADSEGLQTPYPATDSDGIVVNQGTDDEGNPVGPPVGASVRDWTYSPERGWRSAADSEGEE